MQARPQDKSMFVEKLGGRECGWNSTKEKEERGERGQLRPEHIGPCIWPMGK